MAGVGQLLDGESSRADFWTVLEQAVLRLEEAIQDRDNAFDGLSISQVDAYARQISLEVFYDVEYYLLFLIVVLWNESLFLYSLNR